MQLPRLPLNALRTFVVVAKHMNMKEAATELFVTHGAVSHQIRALEEQIGQPVFDRRKRPLRLTPAGEQLRLVVSDSLDRILRSVTAVEGNKISGELTLSCVPGIASNWLVPNLANFLSMHGNIAVKLSTDHWQKPSLSGSADLAITYGSAEAPGRRVIRLGHSDYFPVCSPDLLRTLGQISKPEDIANFTLLHEYDGATWSRWFASVGMPDARAARRVYFDGAHLSLEAARAGCGIAMGDLPTVQADIASGTLVRLFDIAIPAAFPYYLISSPLATQTSAAAAMEAWLLKNFPT